MPKKSASEKAENSVDQKSVNQVIDLHTKNFLTDAEMKKILASARQGKHSVRDFCLMLIAYRHGLRVSELIDIRLKDLDLETGRLFVRRVKGSLSTHQPIEGDELRAIRAWLRASSLIYYSEGYCRK